MTLTNDTLPSKTLDALIQLEHLMVQVLLEYSTKIIVCIVQMIMLQLQVTLLQSYNIAHTEHINGTYTSISNITLDSYDITTSTHKQRLVMLVVQS